MAFITTDVRLAVVFLLSLPVSAAIGREGARPSTIHFQTALQKEGNANSPQMERLIVALAGEWTTEDTYEAGDHASRPRLGHARETIAWVRRVYRLSRNTMTRIVPRGPREFFGGMRKPMEFIFSGAIAIRLTGAVESCLELVSGKATTLYRRM
jgi:hypothetical protein